MSIEWADDLPYGVADFAPEIAEGYKNGSLVRESEIKCCIADCPNWVRRRRTGQAKADDLYCPEHGISISTTPTYIYKDHHRNFIIGRNLLDSVTKVESWRLGNETSEDAVSWNVFLGLQKAEGLKQCFQLLTGVAAAMEPELYLWGNRIADGEAPEFFEGLEVVRKELEPRAGIPTEPDVMMRVPGHGIVLIEAKFGSPNGRFAGKEERFGNVNEYLSRYRANSEKDDPLNRDWIAKQPSDQVLEQLCRNALFAHWLAGAGEKPFVANLVDTKSELDVEAEFGRHLRPGTVTFARHTWDEICRLPIIQTEAAKDLSTYLSNKTLRLQKAFEYSAAESVVP